MKFLRVFFYVSALLQQRFSPHHLIDHMGIALNDPGHPAGYLFIQIIRHRRSVFPLLWRCTAISTAPSRDSGSMPASRKQPRSMASLTLR